MAQMRCASPRVPGKQVAAQDLTSDHDTAAGAGEVILERKREARLFEGQAFRGVMGTRGGLLRFLHILFF
eukprot:CAMPEP_0168472992 /NCGR_PEP_ID=MMETSP0228-20121227/60089_1 /TAXON_ID=133427 /ORGANISM="Protoceratium reticulatum, Strain CCCM 535 (=CCMP 1889)" /LENGTH=69 /DNA_ID=CAMNT_0008488961 /DNA_START=15 /DNA_END=222 /DNA_ORIENTATION=-